MRTGLVLGAGGMTGRAFHLALLAALHDEFGWKANQADVVVGTSAGSLVGACLRSGAPIEDLVCEATHGDLRSVVGTLAAIGPAPVPPPPAWTFGSPPLSLRHLAARARDEQPLRWTAAMSCLVPRGRACTDEHAAWVDRLIGARWPDRPLWVCAVEMPTLARTVWGCDTGEGPAIGLAVAASCAVPGYLAPRIHQGREFVDGGIHSPTNADVLVGERMDRVIISSPMSAVDGGGWTPADRVARRARHRLLRDEALALKRDGTRVIMIEPTAEELQAMRSITSQEPLPAATMATLRASLRARLGGGAFGAWHDGAGSTAIRLRAC
jgi:NTE family protein